MTLLYVIYDVRYPFSGSPCTSDITRSPAVSDRQINVTKPSGTASMNTKTKNTTIGSQITTNVRICRTIHNDVQNIFDPGQAVSDPGQAGSDPVQAGSDPGQAGSVTFTDPRMCQAHATSNDSVTTIVPQIVHATVTTKIGGVSRSPEVTDWHTKCTTTGAISRKDTEIQLSAKNISINPDGDFTSIEQGTKEDITIIPKSTFKEDMCKMCSVSTFSLFIIARVVTYVSYVLPLYFLAPYASGEGFSTDQVNLILTVFGAVDIATRPLHGMILSFLHIDSSVYVGCLVIVAGTVNGR